MRHIEAKVVIVGAQGVGKTSVVTRLTTRSFNNRPTPTVGAAFFVKVIKVGEHDVKLQLWDTAGQERFRSLTPLYYRNSNAAVIMYDISSTESYETAKSWITELKTHVDTVRVFVLVGNKCDIQARREVSTEEAQELARSAGALFFETSAVADKGIEETFKCIAEVILAQKLKEKRSSSNSKSLSSTGDKDSSFMESCRLDEGPKLKPQKSGCCFST